MSTLPASTDATIQVRPSRVKAALWLGAFVLMMITFAVFGASKTWPLYLGAAGLVGLLSVGSLFDTTPRLVLAADGISWRKAKTDSLSFRRWNEVVSADIRSDDDSLSLILKLARPSAPQCIASDQYGNRTINISISGLELSGHQLRVAIHRRAPHVSR